MLACYSCTALSSLVHGEWQIPTVDVPVPQIAMLTNNGAHVAGRKSDTGGGSL